MGDLQIVIAALFVSAAGLNALANWLKVPYPIPLVLGGLVLGLLEAFAASYLSLLTGGAFGAEYKDIFAFSILILILIFRPKGLLGEIVRERA